MTHAQQLRRALAQESLIVAPGAYECISARLIEQAGYPAVYMSGGCTAMMLGYPDYGLVTMSEMAENAGRIAAAVNVPIIADADTGYGNELNVTRTVREYESRGVAAIQIEDQTFPKRCGHLAGKQVIAAADFAKKIAAATRARHDPDTVIVARTDARATHGLDEAVARMNAALDAGADVAFVEALQSIEEIEQVPKLVKGPCLLNFVVGGNTPPMDLGSVERFGYRIAIVPALMLMATIGACDAALGELRTSHRHPAPPAGTTIAGMMNRLGGDAWNALSKQYER